MPIQIEDGRGTGNKVAVSSTGNRLDTSSRANPRIYYASRDTGECYAIHSENASAAAGDFLLYIKNTSKTNNLYIDDVIFDTAQNAKFKLHKVSGTASGSNITPINMNFKVSNSADSDVKGNGAVTGITSAGVLISERVLANDSSEFQTSDALRLGLNDAIAIEYDAGTTGDASVTVIAYFDSE